MAAVAPDEGKPCENDSGNAASLLRTLRMPATAICAWQEVTDSAVAVISILAVCSSLSVLLACILFVVGRPGATWWSHVPTSLLAAGTGAMFVLVWTRGPRPSVSRHLLEVGMVLIYNVLVLPAFVREERECPFQNRLVSTVGIGAWFWVTGLAWVAGLHANDLRQCKLSVPAMIWMASIRTTRLMDFMTDIAITKVFWVQVATC
jgi:hypothetical protein